MIPMIPFESEVLRKTIEMMDIQPLFAHSYYYLSFSYFTMLIILHSRCWFLNMSKLFVHFVQELIQILRTLYEKKRKDEEEEE